MRLLIITQKIDRADTVLGFFHGWVERIAHEVESVSVICLEKGECALPDNVSVYSLGKEENTSRYLKKIRYVFNLYRYLYLIRGSYDKVFVHMNQEYVLLAGPYWRAKNIPVYLWRNHPQGSVLTAIAVAISDRVWCTARGSFTARFKKTRIVSAGVDTDAIVPIPGVVRKKYSVCMVGRVAPIKKIEYCIEAVKRIVSAGGQASLTIVGDTLPRDEHYLRWLTGYVEKNSLSQSIRFEPGVPFGEISSVYSRHEICVNLTSDGSFDKTIVEAAACGAIPLVSNSSLSDILPQECLTTMDVSSISRGIERLFDPAVRAAIRPGLEVFVSSNSLDVLMETILAELR